MRNKHLDEAFSSLLHSNPQQFKRSIVSALKVKLAERLNKLEGDVVSQRFEELAERAGQEERFVTLHAIDKHDYPVENEHMFTSNKKKAGTPADSPDADEMPDPQSTNELMKRSNIFGRPMS